MRKDISIESKHIETEDNPPSCDAITSPFSPNDIRLSTPPMNMGDIIDMIQYHYIDFDTEYQREQNLWSDEDQSRLIESVLLGLRLPAFYFEEVSRKKMENNRRIAKMLCHTQFLCRPNPVFKGHGVSDKIQREENE